MKKKTKRLGFSLMMGLKCEHCHLKDMVPLGRTKMSYSHECNEGNVKIFLPTGKEMLQEILSTK